MHLMPSPSWLCWQPLTFLGLSWCTLVAPLLSKVSPVFLGESTMSSYFINVVLQSEPQAWGKLGKCSTTELSPASWSPSKDKGQVVLKAYPTRVGPF